MKKNKTIMGSALSLMLVATTPNGFSATLKPFRTEASQTAQEAKADKQADRAAAMKKYLEAQSYEQANNVPKAIASYKEAIALDPSSPELRVALGALYLKERNVIDAESQAREAVQVAPDNLEARKLVARIYIAQSFVGNDFKKEKAQEAVKELEEIAKRDANAKIDFGGEKPVPVLALIGDLYWQLDDRDKAIAAIKRVSAGDTSGDSLHFQLAQMLFQENKFREAADAAKKAYDINPKSPQYAGLLAKSLLRLGRTQEALDIYKKALNKKDPKDAKDPKDKDDDDDDSGMSRIGISPLIFDYADALVFAGKYDDAVKELEPILKLARKDSPIYLTAIRTKVDALRRSGKREEAIKTLEDTLKGQDVSDSLGVLYSLAETYEEMQNFDKAVATYEEALGAIVNPDGTVSDRKEDKQNAGLILARIALAYRTAGKRDKAFETFERMRKVLGKDSPRADEQILDALLDEGKNKEALEAANAAVTRFPSERSFKFARAQAAGKLGDSQTVDSTMNSLLKNSSEDSDVYMVWASIQLEANQLKQAEENIKKAINLEPKDIRPLITLSIIQQRQEKVKDAEVTLRKALEIDPENATLLNNLGYFLAERGDRLPEATALIQRAVNIAPTNGSFLDSLGWALFKQGKIQDAQKYLEQAIIYSPRSSAINDHLGDLYKKLGQNDKARAKWEDALKLATEPEEIKKIKEKLGKK